MIKNESSKKEKLKKNMIGMEKVVRTNQLRRTFTMLKVVSNTKIKKICGLKIIQIYFNKLVEERQKYSFSMLKCKYFNKTLDKIYSSNFNFLEKIMTKKNRFYKEKGF